jgi:hypothetical protein
MIFEIINYKLKINKNKNNYFGINILNDIMLKNGVII